MQILMKNQSFGKIQWLRQGLSLLQVVGACAQLEENAPTDLQGWPLGTLHQGSSRSLFRLLRLRTRTRPIT